MNKLKRTEQKRKKGKTFSEQANKTHKKVNGK